MLITQKQVRCPSQGKGPGNEVGVPGAMLYQLSYEATHWERGQFILCLSQDQTQEAER